MSSRFVKASLILIPGLLVLVSASFFTTAEEPTDPQLSATAKPAVLSQADYNPDDPRFLVHEWGTFTSFSGSDGVKLEFRPLVENDLPPFVIDRARQAGVVSFAETLSKKSFTTMQRMETPVTYFYTPEARDVRVKVSFPEGLLTEFYPPVESFLPALSPNETQVARQGAYGNWPAPKPDQVAKQLDAAQKDSELDWGTVTLIPSHSLKPDLSNPQAAAGVLERIEQKLLPMSQAHFDYYYARQTDAAYLHVHRPYDKKLYFRPQGSFFEKFLFYRGIGRFELPLSMQALGEDRFRIVNAGPEPIASLFLVSLDAKNKLRFTALDRVGGDQTAEMRLPKTVVKRAELEKQVQASLVKAGLFNKEALSMVATWRTSWFKEPGTRLFYLLPQSQTDELLPLSVQPAPEETVRVMVGRLEVMTPEWEQRLKQKLKENQPAAAKTTATEKPTPLEAEIGSWGRFAEPALNRVQTISDDPKVTAAVEQVLEELRKTE